MKLNFQQQSLKIIILFLIAVMIIAQRLRSSRPFHNRGQNTKVKIETGSQWIMVTVNEVEACPKYQTDRTSEAGGSGPVLSRHHAL